MCQWPSPLASSSRPRIGYAGGLEGRHVAQQVQRRFDEVQCQHGAGSLAQTHIQIEQRPQFQVPQNDGMARLDRAVGGDQILPRDAALSAGDQCRGPGDEAVENHRQLAARQLRE